MTRPELANQRAIFRVQHPDLEGLLGGGREGLTTYSYNDITNHIEAVEAQTRKIFESERDQGEEAEKARTPFQRDLLHLYESLVLFNRCKSSLELEGSEDLAAELNVYQNAIVAGRASVQAQGTNHEPTPDDLQRVMSFYRRYEELSTLAYPLLIPPSSSQSRRDWSTYRNQSHERRPRRPGLGAGPMLRGPCQAHTRRASRSLSTRPSPATAPGCRRTTSAPS